jgi:hypothetical protein
LGIDEKRVVLYRNFHEINGRVYLVEIARSRAKIFIVLFDDYMDPSSFIAEVLTEKVANKLMSENENLFENFVS